MEGGREERRSLNRAFMNHISLSLVRRQMPTNKPTVQALGGNYPYFIFLFGIPYACTVQYFFGYEIHLYSSLYSIYTILQQCHKCNTVHHKLYTLN